MLTEKSYLLRAVEIGPDLLSLSLDGILTYVKSVFYTFLASLPWQTCRLSIHRGDGLRVHPTLSISAPSRNPIVGILGLVQE